jgi:transcriptional regulator with XRE-family HTH domain
MTVLAATAYLKTLREARNLSQDDVAEAIGASMRQVGAWERGQADPASSSIAAYIRFVHASAEHVVSLLINPIATAEDGAQLAGQWLEESEQSYVRTLDSTSIDDQLHELLDVLRAFRSDPRRLGQVLGYAEGLLEERSARRRTMTTSTH